MIQSDNIVWDETISILRLLGPDVRSFLNGQTTSNLTSINPSTIVHTCWLNTKGKVRALLEIRFLENFADILVLSGEISSLNEEFEKVIFPSDNVEVQSIGSILRVQELCYNKSWNTSHVEWVSTSKELSGLFAVSRTPEEPHR